jgi:hypothetical protein
MAISARIRSVVAFAREHPRRAAAVAGALLALLVAAGRWDRPPVAPAPSRVERSQAPPRTHSYPAPFTAALPEQSPAAPGGGELCGYGPVPLRDGVPRIPPDIEAAAASELHRLADDLAGRSADRERALGLYLQMVSAANAAGAAWETAHGDCADDDAACQSAAAQAIRAATADSRRALVRLATSSSDADAYALAMYSCRPAAGQFSSDDCALLSAAQWARIEPDNAVPWLYLAADAAQRRDRSGLEAALNRASKSRYSDPHWDAISRLLASDATGAPPPVQVQLAIMLLGVQAALPLPELQTSIRACGTAPPAGPLVETCGDLAALLIERGRTVIEALIGSKIAERVGWTGPRLSPLHDQVDAMRWQMSQAMKSAQEQVLLGCDSLQRLRRNASVRAQFGESGLLRRELAESGVSTSQAAERWRAEFQQLESRPTDRAEATR